jgi:cell division protein FtsB
MRRRKSRVLTTVRRLTRSLPVRRETVAFTSMTAVAVWMGWSLLQEIGLTQQLSQQATHLRQQNAALQTTNQDLQRDVSSVASGAQSEEEARKGGYARPNEDSYVVSTPAPARPAGPPATSDSNPLLALWHWLTGSHTEVY